MRLFSYPDITGDSVEETCANINGYLISGSDVFVEKCSQKLGPLSPMLSLGIMCRAIVAAMTMVMILGRRSGNA